MASLLDSIALGLLGFLFRGNRRWLISNQVIHWGIETFVIKWIRSDATADQLTSGQGLLPFRNWSSDRTSSGKADIPPVTTLTYFLLLLSFFLKWIINSVYFIVNNWWLVILKWNEIEHSKSSRRLLVEVKKFVKLWTKYKNRDIETTSIIRFHFDNSCFEQNKSVQD